MNDEYEPEPRLLPPAKLAKSFLIVAGCYTLFCVCWLGTFLILTRFFFPEVFATLQDPDVFEKALENDVESVLPRSLVWSWIATNSVLCLLLGWVVARAAPFGKFSHAVFLAILIFVSGLQQAIGAQQSLVWMFVLMMAAFPIAVLFGARLALSSPEATEDEGI